MCKLGADCIFGAWAHRPAGGTLTNEEADHEVGPSESKPTVERESQPSLRLESQLQPFVSREEHAMKLSTYGLGAVSFLSILAVWSARAQVIVLASDPAYYEGVGESALATAIRVLERSTNGRVLEVRFARAPDDEASFVAVIAKDDELAYIREYPVTEPIDVIQVTELPAWMADWKLNAYMKSAEKAKVPLADAVEAAERAEKAPAVAAGIAKPLDATTAVLSYNVEILRNGKPQRVAIDAESGHRIANPEALYESWTPTEIVRRIAE
jgi:hypothetical protein